MGRRALRIGAPILPRPPRAVSRPVIPNRVSYAYYPYSYYLILNLAARAAVLHDPIAKAHHQNCKSRGLSYVQALKRVARRMSDLVHALLKSGKAYDRSIIEHAIKQRREQAAHAARSHAKQSLVHSRPRKSNSPLSQRK